MRPSTTADRRRIQKSRGLTLIELVVVLTILVAIGSLLVPIIGNTLGRSHTATCASSFPEVTTLIQRAQIETSNGLGDGWTTGVITGTDQPVNNSAAVSAITGSVGDGTGTLETSALDADDITALASIGIDTLAYHTAPAAGYDITFDALAAPAAPVAGDEVITLTVAQYEQIYLPAPEANQRYIWLGIDETWELLGTLTPEPPVHFGDTPGAFPEEVYSRFGAIFLITRDGADSSAEFARVSYCLDGTNFETGDNHIGIFWNEIR